MPKYKKDKNFRIEDEDVQAMIDKTKNYEHRCIISLLYRTGARPIELVLLQMGDIEDLGEKVVFRLKTAKNGVPRNLYIKKAKPFMEHILQWHRLQMPGGSFLSIRSPGTIKNIVYQLSDNVLTPYTFRHNRMTKLAEGGAKPFELMVWKGAKDMKSVNEYLYRSPETLKNVDDGDSRVLEAEDE